ncbi:MAG: hypothetical protein R3Y10_06150 [Ferrimonas sp.]
MKSKLFCTLVVAASLALSGCAIHPPGKGGKPRGGEKSSAQNSGVQTTPSYPDKKPRS